MCDALEAAHLSFRLPKARNQWTLVASVPPSWLVLRLLANIMRFHSNLAYCAPEDIHFDDALFRTSENGEYQRKLIPLFLKRNNMDVMRALEFAREYDIEGIPCKASVNRPVDALSSSCCYR
jgi:hypothetical protein